MKIGIDSLVAILPDPLTGRLPSATARKAELLQEVELADQVGLNVFGVGEHHRIEFLDSARAIILSAVAARNSQIRLTCAVTVLSAGDHVRLFEKLSILDLIVNGVAESVVGRGSFHEAFPLMVVIISSNLQRFRPLINLYRETGMCAGYLGLPSAANMAGHYGRASSSKQWSAQSAHS